jgi:ABC-2 type transport system permease protein
MSTSALLRTAGIEGAHTVTAPIPFSRLVRVEWAKATDTRAARSLLGLVAIATVGLMAVAVSVPTSFEQTHASYLRVASIPQVIFLPVVAILMLTGEWSQRSIITTFTQEPRRIRVVNAKLVVATLIGVGAAVFGGLVAAIGIAITATSDRAFEANLSFGTIAGYLLYLLLNVLAGATFGALVQSSATAIASYFVLNPAVALLGTTSTFVNTWIDTETTWNWVLENKWAGHVPQILCSIVLWLAAPLAAGIARTLRRDVG